MPEARIGSDGAIHFIQRGSGEVAALSWTQIRILYAAMQRAPVIMQSQHLHTAAWGTLYLSKRHGQRLTNAQRASLSRSLRRLRQMQLVKSFPGGGIQITQQGCDMLHWLMNEWGGWEPYTKQFRVTG